MKRIHFKGDSSSCSKWLPFAKKKMDSLKKLYGRRKNWTWERSFQGARISLERNGNIEYIRIYAGCLDVYEFAAAMSQTDNEFGDTPKNQWGMQDLKFGTVRKRTDPNDRTVKFLEMGEPNLRPPEDALGIEKEYDSYIYGGEWGGTDIIPVESGETPSPAFDRWSPRIDWFQVPVPTTPEVAEKRKLLGYKACTTVISTASFTKRHFDRNHFHYFYNGGTYTPIHNGRAVEHKPGGKSYIIPVTMINARPRFNDVVIEPVDVKIGTAAKSGSFYICSSHMGQDFQFVIYDKQTEFTYYVDLSSLRPSIVDGNAPSGKWYFRGDALRCVSMIYANDTDRTGLYSQYPAFYNGFQELEITLVRAENDFLQLDAVTTAGSFIYPMQLLSVDYDIHDGRRRGFILDPWIGEELFENDEWIYGVIIYGKFVILGDNGEILEVEKTIPLLHASWDSDRIQPGGGETFANAFKARHGYFTVRSRISALDLRASAIAMHTAVQIDESFTGNEHIGKRWGIWNEPEFRQKEWIDKLGNPLVGYDPIDDLLSPPAGYAPIPNSLSDTEEWRVYSHQLYESIASSIGHMHRYGFPFPTEIRTWQSEYNDGFKINPKKNFSLFTSSSMMPTPVQSVDGLGSHYPTAIARAFVQFDHVEWFGVDEAGDPAPVTSTHYDLFNNARGTNYAPGDFENSAIESMCANAQWVS